MRTIIAGSRSIMWYKYVVSAIEQARDSGLWPITTVISGGARGVDRLGEIWAGREGVPVEKYPAEWDRYGLAAGAIRNAGMATLAQACIVLWDGKSGGAYNMMQTALACKLTCRFYLLKSGVVQPYEFERR